MSVMVVFCHFQGFFRLFIFSEWKNNQGQRKLLMRMGHKTVFFSLATNRLALKMMLDAWVTGIHDFHKKDIAFLPLGNFSAKVWSGLLNSRVS